MNKRYYSLFIIISFLVCGSNNIALAKESNINISQLKKQAERGDAKTQNKLGDYYASIIRFPDNEGCFPYNRIQGCIGIEKLL